MTTKEIAVKYCIDQDEFEDFLSEYELDFSKGFMSVNVDDGKVDEYVRLFKKAFEENYEMEYEENGDYDADESEDELSIEERIDRDIEQRKADVIASQEKQEALSKMLISSGFNFEGYRIVKYSGYISGDDVVQIEKKKSFWTGLSKTDVGNALSESLVKIRRRALAELKEAAYDLGCNAVIGVDFDYITLDPQIHNGDFTQDLPYVFCVTANGNAVVIEKE